MKKQIVIIIIICILISLAEIIYIISSPRMGVIKEGSWDLKDNIFYNVSYEKNLKPIYDYRPHKNDFTPYKYSQKLMLVGDETLFNIITIGILAYRGGDNLTEICNLVSYKNKTDCITERQASSISLNRVKPNNSTGSLSGSTLYPNTYQSEDIKFTSGDSLIIMYMGWFALADAIGPLGINYFENRKMPICIKKQNTKCIEEKYLNLSERRKEYADLYKYIIIKDNFMKTLISENEELYKGIDYLSYYPYYKGVFIATENIPKEDLESSKITISDKEYNFEIVYPLIFVNDVNLSVGDYKLKLKTNNNEYSSKFRINYRDIKESSWINSPFNNNNNYGIELVNVRGEDLFIYKIEIKDNNNTICEYINLTQYENKLKGDKINPNSEGMFNLNCSIISKSKGALKIEPVDMTVYYYLNNEELRETSGKTQVKYLV
jgi:hypothetical protein